jgi:tripartite-type tricarboxylate transporter receptor subunit TctC
MFRRQLLAATLGLAPLARSRANTPYPNKPLRVIVPYAAGGAADMVTRIVAARLSERLGERVLVDNRPGANGVVAVQALLGSDRDGHTFLVTDGSLLSVNPLIYKNLKYEPKQDFSPVALIARGPLFLAVHPKVQATSLDEFIRIARARPAALSYGTPGIGSTHHLCMETLKAALGIDVVHVPFKGAAQAVQALVAGEIDASFAALPSLQGFVKSGQVRLLAVNSARRQTSVPEVPAIAEMLSGFDFASTMGLVAARGVSADALGRISGELVSLLRSQAVIEALSKIGIEVVGEGSTDYARVIQQEDERMVMAVKAARLQAQ